MIFLGQASTQYAKHKDWSGGIFLVLKTSGVKARSRREKHQAFQVFNLSVSVYINTLDEAFIQRDLQGHNVCTCNLCKHYLRLLLTLLLYNNCSKL